jgi:hypothetical protein
MRCRLTLVVAIAACTAAPLFSAGVAGAEPPPPPIVTTLPERPAPTGTTPFANDPSIVDARPQTIESWSRLPAEDAIAVHFATGTPECYGAAADVQETTDIVAVKLRTGTRPDAVGRACIAIGLTGTLELPLRAPLGNRAVLGIT